VGKRVVVRASLCLDLALMLRYVARHSVHMGEGRGIPEGPQFHESVKRRMGNENVKYKPRARWREGSETYVD
jgi:hypothetical protein